MKAYTVGLKAILAIDASVVSAKRFVAANWLALWLS